MQLTRADRDRLDGAAGAGTQLAMALVVDLAEAMGADELIDIVSAHVDSCFYVGDASVDFARRLRDGGARVAVPTTLNVGSVDLLHGHLDPMVEGGGPAAVELMTMYGELGCQQTWTCAPYQLPSRPALGDHVAWGESNAIAFANSVLGARTERYGDFVDIAAAVVGRVPRWGLHLAENRRAGIHVRVRPLPPSWHDAEVLFPLLGHVVGRLSGALVPVVTGVGPATEDDLKAFGAAAASTGAVALFHVVGSTPEAPTLESVLPTGSQGPEVDVTVDDLLQAWGELCTTRSGRLAAVCLGTPHFSVAEVERLLLALGADRVHEDVALVVSTSRATLHEVTGRGWATTLSDRGVRFVTDTCTYNTRILGQVDGVVLTNSAKWAWYGPANVGCEVVFASLSACVRAAVDGRLPDVPA